MSGKGTVLVTGGAKRIGKEICDVLRKRGWNVLVHSRDPQNPLCIDFAENFDSIETWFEKVVKTAPDLCAIVNNASVFSSKKNVSNEEKVRLLLVNSVVPTALIDLLHRHLERTGGRGGVVNMVDSRIVYDDPKNYYEETKRKLLDVTFTQAYECAPVLRINAVAPGPVLAPSDKANSVPGGDVILDERPTPRDVAETVAYLLEAKSVTGQTVAVDSGQSLI